MRRSKSIADMRTPMDLIIKRHPEQYMEKWNKRTTGGQQWPKEGTFDPICCDEMDAVIKHHKPTDKSDKREELNKQLKEQVEDNKREIDLLLQEEDRQKQEKEERRAENDRLCALALQEEECEQYSRGWCQKWGEQLTQEERECHYQYARVKEKDRKGRKSHVAKSSGWQHLTSTPAEQEVQTLPEGMDSQEERVRGRSRSPIQSPNNGPADRRREQRQEWVGRPSEGGPKRSISAMEHQREQDTRNRTQRCAHSWMNHKDK
ncbi:hypothetical protein SKAU_G00209600 [Synaphobranchus kaupii]|uniref:Uncharacterized protein n=1 Tax=Synaphobranchus kaupii TaxID=118154 RepID=A0A9Q1F8M8_SYNKA|nr:hypothetical protein SKAU_G00209600 [Synaphobranchus kaupii]